MAKKKINGVSMRDDAATDAAQEAALKALEAKAPVKAAGGSVLKVMDQLSIDKLFAAAMAGDSKALEQLKELEKQGLIHIPKGSQKPLFGPKPVEVPVTEPHVSVGDAKKGKNTGKKLPKATSDLGARNQAAADAQAKKKALEAEELKKAEGRSVTERPVETRKEVTKAVVSEVVDEPLIAPKAPVKAEAAKAAVFGTEKANAWFEEARLRGVDGSKVLKNSSTGVKQLDQLPDTPEVEAYLKAWLDEEAGKPGAISRAKMLAGHERRQAAKPAAQVQAEATERAAAAAARLEVRRNLPGEAGETITLDDLKKFNFDDMAQINYKGFSDRLVKNKIVLSGVEKKKAAAVEALNKTLNRLEGGRPKTLLADKLEAALQHYRDAKSSGEINRATSKLAAIHGEFFTGGQVRGGVYDLKKTGAVVRAEIAEEALTARGRPMNAVYRNKKKLAAEAEGFFQSLLNAEGVKSMTFGEFQEVLAAHGVVISTNDKSIEGLFAAMREEDVKKMTGLINAKKNPSLKKASKIQGGVPVPQGEAVAAEGVEAATEAGSLSERFRAASGVPEGAAAAGPSLMPADRATKLRSHLQANGLTEEGLLKAVNKQAKNGPYTKIEELPENLDKRIASWVKRNKKPVAAAAAATPTAPTPGGGAAATEPPTPSRGFSEAGPKKPSKVGKGFRKEMAGAVPEVPTPTPKAPGTFTTGGRGGALAKYDPALAKSGTQKAVDLANKVGKAGKLAELARFLGPIGLAFGVYEILSRLKGETLDKADDERMKVMQALGGVRGGLDEDAEIQRLLGQQNTMINMAGIQRQRDLDAMRRQYTDNNEMNGLIRSNENLLASLAMPSQPSVAELMSRM